MSGPTADLPASSRGPYYEANLAALGERAIELERYLLRALPPEVEVNEARTGAPTISYKGVRLHSHYDPETEARHFAERAGAGPGDFVLLYGFGLGYHAEALAELVGDGGQLVVLELNRAVLSAAFQLRDLRRLLSRPNVWLATAASEHEAAVVFNDIIGGVFGAVPDERRHVLIHTPLLSVAPDGYERLVNALEVIQIERSAAAVHHDEAVANLVANVEAVADSPGVADVLPALAGQPVFLVSAGPSLDEALPHLVSLQHRAWIITVDTVYEALRGAGVSPDFVVTVDPQPASAEHFAFDPTPPGALIFIPTAAREVVARFRGRKLVVVQAGHSVVSTIEDLIAAKGVTNSGGSAACVALDLAVRQGVSRLFFVGQDCAFPDWKVYSANLARNRHWLQEIDRFRSLEGFHRTMAYLAKVVHVTDRYGAPVPTHQSLFSYLRELERIVKAHPECEFYNFFSRGASIRGVSDVQLVEQIEELLPAQLDKRWEAQPPAARERLRGEIRQRLDLSLASALSAPPISRGR
ncbi:MAG: DUF115 domain-containing protein [Verrucomicrobia bacterium]|nr:DUF115 domain-containing protein [Verrucomicrobiota bacterium]